jgi:hypothetical protein
MIRRRCPRCPGFFARFRLFLATLPMLLLTAVANAQESTAAPQPTLQKSPPVWLGLLVIFIMLVLVVMVSLMPSRRSHQD